MKPNYSIEAMQRTYSVIVETDEGGGYIGRVAGLPGCISQGETVDELLEHMKEALELYLSVTPEAEPVHVYGVREIVL
jgi:predicted RNase H-like HicB family nuclease